MSNITKIKDKETGVIYPIEDSEAREDISELRSAIDQKGESVEIKAEGTSLVINTDLVNGNEVSF